MITNNAYAISVTEKTMEAIEVKYSDAISSIKNKIDAAANNTETSVEITSDDVNDIQKIGNTIKQYFLYNGFDVKFMSGSGKVIISWKIEKPKQMATQCPQYPIQYL